MENDASKNQKPNQTNPIMSNLNPISSNPPTFIPSTFNYYQNWPNYSTPVANPPKVSKQPKKGEVTQPTSSTTWGNSVNTQYWNYYPYYTYPSYSYPYPQPNTVPTQSTNLIPTSSVSPATQSISTPVTVSNPTTQNSKPEYTPVNKVSFKITTPKKVTQIKIAQPPPPPETTSTGDQTKESNHNEWPPNLKKFVERSFSSCKDLESRTKMESSLKSIISQAMNSNTLWGKDWDNEPIPQ